MYYKLNNGQLLKGNNVYNKNYILTPEDKNEIDNWKWFDNEDEAYIYFGIEKPILNEKPNRKIIAKP